MRWRCTTPQLHLDFCLPSQIFGFAFMKVSNMSIHYDQSKTVVVSPDECQEMQSDRPDPYTLSPPMSDLCGHQGANFVFSCVQSTGAELSMDHLQSHTKYLFDQDSDSYPFFVTHQLHLWPPGGQLCFSLVCVQTQDFVILRTRMGWTKM